MKIAICDDDRICRARVVDIATDYSEERMDKDVTFEVFSDPENLLQTVRQNGHYDIYVLDIVMPGMNGIELGKALREDGCESKIIYLTGSEEYAIDSFKIRAFHYLLKPVEKTSFYAALDEAISSISVKRDKGLIVKTRDNRARIAFDSILYAELAKRAILYHLVGGKTVESTSLRTTFTEAVQELLADKRFALCGASMVVNLNHITMVETEGIVFKDAEKVFLGKKACRELRGVWNEYWLSEEGGK
ncbi:MAG: response regulator transcription factor [Clostridia bacterium]|nr:response regulator transcription factor [Clostridia bacterium]